MTETEIEKTEVTESLPTDEKLALEPDIPREDSTPTVEQQADSKGFHAELYNFGKLEGDGSHYFNPSIVERPDGYWMLTRRSEPHPQGFRFGQNAVWSFQLDHTGKVPLMAHKLRWPSTQTDQHFEDPRGFYHPRMNCTCVGACTFVWYRNGTWTGAHQCFGQFDEKWVCQQMDYPRVGGNPGKLENIRETKNYEKNWLWWLHDGQLHLLYKSNPWEIIAFGKDWNDRTSYKWMQGGLKWAWGHIRGGTPPIKVGQYYFTFHHSSLPWRGNYRRYYAGCIAFDAHQPFRPRLITREPLLCGSQNDPWVQRKPLVVFPCGSVFKNGRWLVSMGINDIAAGWMEISHDKLFSLMSSVDDGGDAIFGGIGLSEAELKNLSGGVESRHATLTSDVDSVDGQDCKATSGSGDPPAQKFIDALEELEPRKVPMRKRRHRKKRQYSPEVLAKLRANAANARAAIQNLNLPKSKE